ncbi:MAG: hypothetical protein HYV07_30230 [Deltaproteobacteria bacterium]|nr:hypothetical protein [Deltaproteobacteria bacterium]
MLAIAVAVLFAGSLPVAVLEGEAYGDFSRELARHLSPIAEEAPTERGGFEVVPRSVWSSKIPPELRSCERPTCLTLITGETFPAHALHIRASRLDEACLLEVRVINLRFVASIAAAARASTCEEPKLKDSLRALVRRLGLSPGSAPIAAVFDLPSLEFLDAQEGAVLSEYFRTAIASRGFAVVPSNPLEAFDACAKACDTSCELQVGRALAAQLAVVPKVLRLAS